MHGWIPLVVRPGTADVAASSRFEAAQSDSTPPLG
jgi:hypothetical protein